MDLRNLGKFFSLLALELVSLCAAAVVQAQEYYYFENGIALLEAPYQWDSTEIFQSLRRLPSATGYLSTHNYFQGGGYPLEEFLGQYKMAPTTKQIFFESCYGGEIAGEIAGTLKVPVIAPQGILLLNRNKAVFDVSIGGVRRAKPGEAFRIYLPNGDSTVVNANPMLKDLFTRVRYGRVNADFMDLRSSTRLSGLIPSSAASELSPAQSSFVSGRKLYILSKAQPSPKLSVPEVPLPGRLPVPGGWSAELWRNIRSGVKTGGKGLGAGLAAGVPADLLARWGATKCGAGEEGQHWAGSVSGYVAGGAAAGWITGAGVCASVFNPIALLFAGTIAINTSPFGERINRQVMEVRGKQWDRSYNILVDPNSSSWERMKASCAVVADFCPN